MITDQIPEWFGAAPENTLFRFEEYLTSSCPE